ncbi:MAG TPA: hypothetical protein VM912_09930, partial [Terriglobales bacterium]|nr:hypothetical protein [Terriglobales bacterium]
MALSRDVRGHGLGTNEGTDSSDRTGTAELERLAQFFPQGTRVKVPVEVARLPLGTSERASTVLEYGTAREVIF